MNQSTRKKPAKPVCRTIRLTRPPTDSRPGRVVMTQDGKATTFLLTRLDSEIGGTAYQLDKLEVTEAAALAMVTLQITERYNVLLHGEQSSCDCKWGCYGQGKHCRHVAGLAQLHHEGKLA